MATSETPRSEKFEQGTCSASSEYGPRQTRRSVRSAFRFGRLAIACLGAVSLASPILMMAAPAAPAAAATSFVLKTQGPCTGWGNVILAGSSYAPGIASAPDVYGNLHNNSCANAYAPATDSYGLEHQCTEFAVHWAASVWGVSPSAWRFVDAEQMFSQAQHITGLTAIANGTGAPQPGDLIVFSDRTVGHVAVIAGVSGGSLYFVGQNQGEAEQAITISNGNYVTPAVASRWLGQSGSVLGWIHSSSTTPATATSVPAVVLQPNGSPSVFVEGPNNTLLNDWYVGGKWLQTTLPATMY